MSSIGFRINYTFNRVDSEIIDKLGKFPVANIDDCMNRMAAIEQGIKPFNKAKLSGSAFTIRLPEGDNLIFHKALDIALPGDVIMIDAGGVTNRAIFGELMVSYCRKRGIAGIVVDGSIRDVESISKMDFPVYARGVTPNGPYKNGPGEINIPISIGGKIVYPGDIVIGDLDGVVIIRPQYAEKLIKMVTQVAAKEEELMGKIMEEGTYLRPWVDEKLKEIGYEL